MDFVFNSLHLDSTYAMRNQIILLLKNFLDIVGYRWSEIDSEDNNNSDFSLFDFEKILNRKRILTLIECLWDTYAINKDVILEILLKIDSQIYKDNVIKFKLFLGFKVN